MEQEGRGYTYLADGEGEERLSFAELDERARGIAARLQEQVKPGDAALLLYPPGLDFIAAFFGCLYAGVVAVPAYPPQSSRSFPRLVAIARDVRPAVALTTSALLRRLQAAQAEVPELRALRCLATDEIPTDAAGAWREPAVGPDNLAFLQYTSGSTASPKGVMVTHGNLLHNEEMIRQAFAMSRDSVVVGWLPLYHDMGLIGNVLQPLAVGAPCVLMSPTSFLQQPLRWLEAISRFRGTTSGGPNFAYELCVRKITPGQREQIDLSSWTVAFNGAEPVRAETQERFARAFASCGFRHEAFYPCYGLAEATLFVAGGTAGRLPAVARLDGRELVSCGTAWMDQQVLIVDPETARIVPEGQVGEIWVSGPSVARGYWRQPELTEHDFQARLDGGGPEGPFLRTGDLGFLHGGELFVAGRLKDLIILRGRNLYPQDVELTVERSHPALRPGCTAAFAVEGDGEERLAVVQEVDRGFQGDPGELVAAIRRAVTETHEAAVHTVALVQAGTIPKTSSGKIQRRVCRTLLLKGELELIAVAEEPATVAAGEADETLSFLRGQVAQLAGIPMAEIDDGQPVTALGLDSLGAVELSHRIEERFGVLIPLASLLEGPPLADVASRIAAAGERAEGRIESSGEEEGDQPLSHGQQALWFLQRLDPGSAAYNVPAALRVHGPLELDTLEEAASLITRRHSSLRSSFHAGPDGPVRRVHRRRAPEILIEDAGGAELDERLHQRLHQEAWRPFDLERDPLLRLAVFRQSAEEHVLLITVHHIVSDLWSLAVLKRDLDLAYRALRGEAVEIPAPPRLRFADSVRWQERRLAGPEGERLQGFWQERLAGELPETTLLPDRPRAARAGDDLSIGGGSLSARLDPEASDRLRRLARSRGTTLSTALMTGFLALLHRYTGQDDLLVGVPTDGRDRPELSDLVGYLVNPVVVRADLAGDPAFEALLGAVRGAALSAYEHREMPFPVLVELLQPERDASRPPLFQTLFVFQRSPTDAALDLGPFALGAAGATTDLAGLRAESVALESRAVRFDLELVTAELGREVGLSLRWDGRLFERATLEGLLGHLLCLLEGAAGEPSRTLSALPLWRDADLRQMLADPNRPMEIRDDGATLHGLVQAQAGRTPDALAVVDATESVTYRELLDRATHLARHLSALGVAPEEPVAVCLDRRTPLVSSLLAVLQAGGAYVPIDPAYPRERQGWLMEDSGARVLITRTGLGTDLGAERTLFLDTVDGLPVAELPRNTPPGLAYLIYTSGSTGRPKGVAIEHRSAAAMVRWALDVYPPEALARTVAATSVCFDLSIFELFVPLSCGGTVLLVDDALAVPAVAGLEPTLLNTVPSALAELLHLGALPPSIRTVNLAGEPLRRPLVEEAYETGTVERVFNLYGPSEDTTYSTWTLVPRGAGLPVTIGRPLAGTQARVLDARMQPVPSGAPGELYLGGAGLARGYFGRPELTAERFVPDPFGAQGDRLYRTGDRVRVRLADGEIEFLGRIDHQVKVRGFRVEPGEVEALLGTHPEVREALVTAFEAGPGDLRLAAYVACGASAETLRAFLHERLPSFMVPGAWVLLPALPRTPNGKVDRKRLPPPDTASALDGFVAPRNAAEAQLADLWREVLQVPRVGVHDDFFALGGHSMLAARLLSRVNAAFQVELSLRALFEHRSVADLAAAVEALRRGAPARPLPPLRPLSRGGTFPLSFAQERLWVMDRLVPGSPVYNVFQALRLSGPLDARSLEAAFTEVVRRHEVLRTVFPAVSGDPVQEILPAMAVALPVEDLTRLPAGEREETSRRLATLAAEEARAPFDLTSGPLFRLRLLRLEDREHVLLLTLHHIVCDDWSLGVLAREIQEIYRAARDSREGRPPRLPELPVQYGDFAVWQRECLTGEALEEKLAYWKAHLGSAPPVLALPTDRPRPAVQTFRGSTRRVRVPAALAGELRGLARAEGASLFMALLTGYAAMLSRAAGQPEVVVGCASAGRDRMEIEGLIGFFVNILPVRLDLSGTPAWRELLGRVRAASLGAYDHPDLPFEKLVAALQPRRDLGHAALRQVGFAFENHVGNLLELPGLASRPLDVDTGVSRLDLTLFLWEEAESGDLAGVCEYNTDLFDASTVDRFLERFHAELAAMAGGADGHLPALATRVALPAASMPESNLTSSQLLFWFANALNPDVQLYFDLAITTYEVAGELEPEPFRQAFQRLIDHCDALRSMVRTERGVPMRIVADRIEAPLEIVDLSAEAEPRAAYESWLAGRSRRRLALEERLFDGVLVRLAPDRWVWYWTVHHIIADAWSLSHIAHVLSSYYELARAGRLDEAQPLPSYQLYVDYERELRGSRRWERAREYWERTLSAPWSRNQFYRRDPSLGTTRAERHTVALGEAESQAVQATTVRHELFSPAILFATVLFSLVHRLSGERTLRVGTPFANRSEQFAEVVGLQMNACPLQVHLDDGDTFVDLAWKIQEETVRIARWQFYPVRNPVEAPVYDVYYNHQNVSFREFCGLPVTFDLINSGHTHDLIDLQVRDFSGSGLFTVDLDLNAAAFDPVQARRTVGHFFRLLEAFETDGHQPVSGVEMLSREERRQVVEELNETAVPYPPDLLLHELIEAQVERAPDAEAVAFEGERISYRELDRRANRLARRLRELGAGPDARVGVYAERSIDMVVALLGTLKAGGSYVPLDPGYPAERVALMARDARMPVILTQSSLAETLPGTGAAVLCLDGAGEEIERQPDSPPDCPPDCPPDVALDPSNLAYVIFTSGSTGRPKGAMLTHAGICNRLLWMQDAYGLGPGDRVLQKTPFSFDVSVWEFFWPLMTGATLVMARPGGHQDPVYLSEIIESERVTTLHFVPSMLQAFLARPEIGPCSSLRRVVMSGEALPEDLRRRFYERLPAVDLHNLYGPTEASVDVTFWACPRENPLGTVPIGRPIANTRIHLIDRAANPVPFGIPGELAIGGVSLARGYLDRPDLTAERFVPDPFAPRGGGRLYRTGDLARFLPDGAIEYLGRLDHQVKLRGVRIELGEIEAAVTRHPGVREAAVVLREDRPGDRRIVAYVAGGEAVPGVAELRSFLKDSLPEPMVPAAVVRLEALPLTPSGKVDRRALPAPDQGALQTGEFVAPRSPLEALLASIWAEVLETEQVSVLDSFFDLGGSSLAATRVTTLVQEVLPVQLRLRDIFESPTVARVAARLEEAIRGLGEAEQLATADVLAEFELLMQGEPENALSAS